MIGTFFADDKASTVLCRYEDITLSEIGMQMEMLGPGNKERLLETCRKVVIENKSNTETNGDVVSQIYSAFLYSAIREVSIMQSATLDHYVMKEMEGLADLRTVFEEMDSEATVFMIRTRTPYHAGGVVFKFKARMITSMRQVREMMTTSMISEGEDIAMKIAAVYKETALPGPHEDLRSSAMLHH